MPEEWRRDNRCDARCALVCQEDNSGKVKVFQKSSPRVLFPLSDSPLQQLSLPLKNRKATADARALGIASLLSRRLQINLRSDSLCNAGTRLPLGRGYECSSLAELSPCVYRAARGKAASNLRINKRERSFIYLFFLALNLTNSSLSAEALKP